MSTGASRRIRLTAEERRARILAEATAQIAVLGYQGLTMAALAKACGLTHPGLLHHFPSKRDLLVEVLRHRDEADAEAAAPGEVPHDVAGFIAVLDALAERNVHQPEIVRLYTVLAAEALNPDHPAHEYFRDRLQQIRTLVVETLDVPPQTADDLAVDYLSFMDGLQLNWLRDPSIDFVGRWRVYAATLSARAEQLSAVDG